MILKYPLGLLGLLGIPILILIYIIKSKYTEQTLASTYLWRLSEKFLKHRKTKKSISGLISLILQIIAVISISLVIAHPVFTVKGGANEYCFIIDASGSMNMELNGKTRLEAGKAEVEKIINESGNGSTYTIISLKDSPEVLLERNSDKSKAIDYLESIKPSDMSGNISKTLGYAQYYFEANRSVKTYVVTDKELKADDKLSVINVNGNEENYALLAAEVGISLDSGFPNLLVKGEVISYISDKTLTVELYIDDKPQGKQDLEVEKGKAKEFSFINPSTSYSKVEVLIKNEDGLMSDNNKIFYNLEESHSYNALVVSDHPTYIENVLLGAGNIGVTLMDIDEYNGTDNISGYSLYVFDALTPRELPSDGAVWLFGLEENLKGTGFTVQRPASNDDEFINLSLNKSSNSLFKRLTNGLIGSDVAVKRYNSYGLIRSFTVLYEYEKLPMIFTGTNDYGNREVVFAFDLHHSNFPLQMDYITLAKNLIEYTFPVILDKANYECGDTLMVNILSNCDSIRVETPSNRASYLDTSNVVGEYLLAECGSYRLVMRFGDEEKIFNVFVSLPAKESYDSDALEYKLQGDKEDKSFDGYYDELIAIFIILAVIYMADWMVYCYEQYQLR